MSAKTQRIQGESLDKRKLSSDNVASLNEITENNTSNISAIMTQNIEVFIKTNFIKKNGNTEDSILLEQSEPDIKLEPFVVKTEYPTMEGIDIGPANIEPQENSGTMVKMHSEESSWSKYFSEFATYLPEEHAKRKFLIQFLEAYRASPGLWDINSEDFRDPNKREVQCANLLTKYREYYPDGDRKEMQKKINGYRSHYNKELRKIDYLNNGHIGSGKKYVSNLWYFDLFSSMCGNKESLDPINKVIPSTNRKASFAEIRRLRAKRRRDALKRDPIKLAVYREKAKERARIYRARLLSNDKEQILEKNRIRQRIYRDRKKNETQIEESCEPYACKNTLGKAVAKVERALPKDLDNRIEVINALYEKYGNSTT
ncbi:uncharacterized protein LOC135439050 [Drosophila montana]|uniref:uncharacterized protein LOC135439050 n=1 Tax=Drosophila montana TaxID=40370 RepID=UPI00313CF766